MKSQNIDLNEEEIKINRIEIDINIIDIYQKKDKNKLS